MEFNELQKLNEQESRQIIGGALPLLLIAGTLAFLALPLFKNLFDAKQAEFSLPGGFKTGWNNHDSTKVTTLEAKINNLTKKFNDIIPPFYEV